MLLIDGDIIAYRIACACENDEEGESHYRGGINSYVSGVLLKYPEMDYIVYLTGKGNFRYDVAVTAPYKGNRGEKPALLEEVRQYLLEAYDAVVIEGKEADDAIATAASTLYKGEAIMASIDKDFDQVPGKHYNFVKGIEYTIEPEEGLLNFYIQILVGDAVDNIIGVDGVGNVGAREMLQYAKEADKWEMCVDQLGYDRALENARLVWLQREEGQMWEPPVCTLNKGDYK
jgi:5'-3' exonuclease